jgi:hypothetical protein
MNATKGVGLGLGAVVAGAVASCPIVQGAVFGALGAVGLLPLVARFRPVLMLVVFCCAALAVYGIVRSRRARGA